VARPQVLRDRTFAEAAQVDDLGAGGRRGIGEAARRLAVACCELGGLHGMHEVVGGLTSVERLGQAGPVGHVERDGLAAAPVLGGATGGGSHLVAGGDQRRDQGAADEAGCAGHQRSHRRTLARQPA